ncbi:MAG: metal-dependent hydrolase, partial [Pseudomonadota bacterium]
AAGIAVSVLPDVDVIAFHLGIPYSSEFGHRGFSHSLMFAAMVALAGAAFHRPMSATSSNAFLFLFFSAASHGILDAFTNGGLGIAFLWPFSDERYFAWARVIEVSPIGLSSFLSAQGAAAFISELYWVWLPCAVGGGLLGLFRKGLIPLRSGLKR